MIKTTILAIFVAASVTLISCGPSEEEQEKTQQDLEEKVEDIFQEIEASMEKEEVTKEDTTEVPKDESGAQE